MKVSNFVFAVFAGTAASIGAACADTVFEGRLIFSDVQNCADQGLGERYTSLYYLANLNGNSNRTSLTMVRDLSARGYQISGDVFTNVFKTVDGVETGSGAHAYTSKLRITKSIPITANITATTDFVSLYGQIKNPQDDPNGLNCLVSFRASYVRRIE